MPVQEIHFNDDRPLQDIADLLVRSHKVVLVTGAGISTSCGIPDFRSKDGLYNLLPSESLFSTPSSSAPCTPSRKRRAADADDDLPPSSQSSTTSANSRSSSSTPSTKLRGQDLFDASVWKHTATTSIFYQFISSLRQKIRDDIRQTSLTHKFIRTLRDGGRLMRCYTQNIDGLEAREGLSMDMNRGKGNRKRFMRKIYDSPRPIHVIRTEYDGGCEVVPLHGDLDRLRCNLCQAQCSWNDDATATFMDGVAPECETCSTKSHDRLANGKRGLSIGILRPNIVLYGEEHPSNQLLAPLVPFDIASNPEVLIILGTSLKVFGLQKIVRDFAKAIHARKDRKGRVIFVNRTSPAESVWDGVIDDYIAMDCDDWVTDLRGRREDLWLRQGELALKTTKPRKRKDKSSDDDNSERPAKKSRKANATMVSIDIPIKTKLDLARVHDEDTSTPPPADSLEHALPTPPPSRAKPLKLDPPVPQILARAPLTPIRRTHWKRNMYDNPLELMLSPKTPEHSPLNRSFRSNVIREHLRLDIVPGSPERPPWSPIKTPTTYRKSKLSVWEDAELEVEESNDGEEEGSRGTDETIVVDTPRKTECWRAANG